MSYQLNWGTQVRDEGALFEATFLKLHNNNEFQRAARMSLLSLKIL